MISLAQFGAGRIGQIHARNAAAAEGVRLKYVIDVNESAARSLADAVGATASDRDGILRIWQSTR